MGRRTFRADRVLPLRKALGMTQQDLADELDVSQSLVAQWEKGQLVPTGPAAILLSQLKAKADLEKIPVPA